MKEIDINSAAATPSDTQEATPNQGTPPDNGEGEGEEKSYLGYNTEGDEADDPTQAQEPERRSATQALNDARAKAQSLFQEFSQVASNAHSRKFLIIAFLALMSAFGYFTFNQTKSPDDLKKEAKQKEQEKVQSKKDELIKTAAAPPSLPSPDQGNSSKVPSLKLEPPPIEAPKPPEPPPPPVPAIPMAPSFPSYNKKGGATAVQLPSISDVGSQGGGPSSLFKDDEERKRALIARRKASIIVLGASTSSSPELKDGKGNDGKPGGDGTTKGKEGDKYNTKKTSSGYLGFGNGSLESASSRTSAAKSVSATYMGNLHITIAQGKMIDAVLESAVNTMIPGTLRAIVSRDIYAESGKNILIPKGSRLIGSYKSDLEKGQSRIAVMWERLIRPDGVDIAIASSGTDDLGRTGITGYMDDKFWIKMGTAFLTSYIIPTIAQKLSNVKDNTQISSTTTTGGGNTSTNTTGTVGSQQLQDSTQKFQDIATKTIEDAFNTKPIITIDQGTTIKVFVNQDIIFPEDFVYGGMTVIK